MEDVNLNDVIEVEGRQSEPRSLLLRLPGLLVEDVQDPVIGFVDRLLHLEHEVLVVDVLVLSESRVAHDLQLHVSPWHADQLILLHLNNASSNDALSQGDGKHLWSLKLGGLLDQISLNADNSLRDEISGC